MSENLSKIPFPPERLLDLSDLDAFAPAPELNEFLETTILNENHALFNLDHIHLSKAKIGFLWTNAQNSRHGKRIVGTAEIPFFRGNKWQIARQKSQIVGWFGWLPDFIITLDALYRAECEPIEFLATFEHELYHCGQKMDLFEMPKFSKQTGLPLFTINGHSIEEHTGVVARYGIQATGQDRVDFVKAALAEPLIGAAKVRELCGTC